MERGGSWSLKGGAERRGSKDLFVHCGSLGSGQSFRVLSRRDLRVILI